jgi:hypothetical protein
MKRFIVAVAIALSTAPTLANVNAPFEQSELDRALPIVEETGNASYGATLRLRRLVARLQLHRPGAVTRSDAAAGGAPRRRSGIGRLSPGGQEFSRYGANIAALSVDRVRRGTSPMAVFKKAVDIVSDFAFIRLSPDPI